MADITECPVCGDGVLIKPAFYDVGCDECLHKPEFDIDLNGNIIAWSIIVGVDSYLYKIRSYCYDNNKYTEILNHKEILIFHNNSYFPFEDIKDNMAVGASNIVRRLLGLKAFL